MKIQITKQGFFLLFVYRYIIFGFDLIISILHLQRAKIPESVSNSADNISKRKNWRESKKKNMLIFKINKPMKVFWYSLLHVLQIYSPDNFRTKNGDFCGICGPNWFHLSKVTVPLVMHNSQDSVAFWCCKCPFQTLVSVDRGNLSRGLGTET